MIRYLRELYDRGFRLDHGAEGSTFAWEQETYAVVEAWKHPDGRTWRRGVAWLPAEGEYEEYVLETRLDGWVKETYATYSRDEEDE